MINLLEGVFGQEKCTTQILITLRQLMSGTIVNFNLKILLKFNQVAFGLT